jgi:hypothetical protein
MLHFMLASINYVMLLMLFSKRKCQWGELLDVVAIEVSREIMHGIFTLNTFP